jgi:Flp pilus assembly pilin Flp
MPTPIDGDRDSIKELMKMLNLVEKFTPEAVEVTDDDGVVAIEYVLMAGLVAVGVGIVLAKTDVWTKLTAKLDGVLA